jgi:hypothetical protein
MRCRGQRLVGWQFFVDAVTKVLIRLLAGG